MIVVGVTGHQILPAKAKALLEEKLPRLMPRKAFPLVGATSLAAGADQLFADFILRSGGELYTVVPCRAYEASFEDAEDRRSYETFLKKSRHVERLPYPSPSEEAFFAAGRRIAEMCDWLVAVWDGQPSRGLGGTGDVVAYANGLGKRVEVVWPVGVVR